MQRLYAVFNVRLISIKLRAHKWSLKNRKWKRFYGGLYFLVLRRYDYDLVLASGILNVNCEWTVDVVLLLFCFILFFVYGLCTWCVCVYIHINIKKILPLSLLDRVIVAARLTVVLSSSIWEIPASPRSIRHSWISLTASQCCRCRCSHTPQMCTGPNTSCRWSNISHSFHV